MEDAPLPPGLARRELVTSTGRQTGGHNGIRVEQLRSEADALHLIHDTALAAHSENTLSDQIQRSVFDIYFFPDRSLYNLNGLARVVDMLRLQADYLQMRSGIRTTRLEERLIDNGWIVSGMGLPATVREFQEVAIRIDRLLEAPNVATPIKTFVRDFVLPLSQHTAREFRGLKRMLREIESVYSLPGPTYFETASW